MKSGSYLLFLCVGVGLSVYTLGCRPGNQDQSAHSLADGPLEPYQAELLDVAFTAGSAMPTDPHIKNRSRVQEAVVTTCLEMEQPERALEYLKQIENWRRGTAYGDLALYAARHGLPERAKALLAEAAQVAEEAQDWRKDRIRVKIAQTYAYLGQMEAAAEFEEGVERAESGKVARIEAMTCPPEAFDEQMEAIDGLVSSGEFDVVRNALVAYIELFDRFYENVERRALVEERIKAAWESMPIFVRIELLMATADAVLEHADQAKALALIDEAKAIMDSADWQPRAIIPLMARLAELRFRADDEERARAELEKAVDVYEAKREQIVNIYRAETILPVAEAYHAMGDTAKALELYARAVEEGVVNPNSRPRAEDLAATCCSMALHGVEPSPGLWSRIREVREGLGDPW